MTNALQTSHSPSEPVEGLSDEREAERWAAALGGGLGETLATIETADLQDLGLSG